MDKRDYEYLGKQLQDIRDKLLEAWEETPAPTCHKIDGVIMKVDRMRNKLDNDYARDCPPSEWRSETFYRGGGRP